MSSSFTLLGVYPTQGDRFTVKPKNKTSLLRGWLDHI
jgi:hypothetical protein